MRRKRKITKFYLNSKDNNHCLQACVKSVLHSNFENLPITANKVDVRTWGKWAWSPSAVVLLDDLNLDAKLFSSAKPPNGFDYGIFAKEGMSYLENLWSKERLANELEEGGQANIEFAIKSSKTMVEKGLWEDKDLENEEIDNDLTNDCLVIGKTFSQWLDGKFEFYRSHFIVLIKDVSPSHWRVHDPGEITPKPNRYVRKVINNRSILLESIVIRGVKEQPH